MKAIDREHPELSYKEIAEKISSNEHSVRTFVWMARKAGVQVPRRRKKGSKEKAKELEKYEPQYVPFVQHGARRFITPSAIRCDDGCNPDCRD